MPRYSQIGAGLERGMTALAGGIAARRKQQADDEAKRQAAMRLEMFLREGGKIGAGTGFSELAPFFNLNEAIGLSREKRAQEEAGATKHNVHPLGGGGLGYTTQTPGQPPIYGGTLKEPEKTDRGLSLRRRSVMNQDGTPFIEEVDGTKMLKTELFDPNAPEGSPPIGFVHDPLPTTERKSPNLDQLKVDIIGKFNADPQVRKSVSMSDAARIITDILDSGNPIGDSSIATFMARASGEVGNLSEADKAPFGGSRAILTRIQQVAQRAADGTLTDENRKFVADLAATFRQSSANNIAIQAKRLSRQYSKGFRGLDEKEVYGFLNPDDEQKMNRQQMIDDFTAEEGRPPTEQELEALKLKGIWE